MSITDRLKFIAKSYLNSLSDGGLGKKARKALEGVFESNDDGAAEFETGADPGADGEGPEISMEEFERRFQAEFGDLERAARAKVGSRPRGERGRPKPKPDVLAKHYLALELKPGATLAEVQAQFKKLMKKYHPDRYAADPKKQAWATRMSQTVSESFSALEKALQGA